MKTINIPVKLKNKQFTGDFDIIKSEIDNGNTIKSFAFETGEIVFNFDKHTAKAPKLTVDEPKPNKSTSGRQIGDVFTGEDMGEDISGVIVPVVLQNRAKELLSRLKQKGFSKAFDDEVLDSCLSAGILKLYKFMKEKEEEEEENKNDIDEKMEELKQALSGSNTKVIEIKANSKEEAVKQIREMLDGL